MSHAPQATLSAAGPGATSRAADALTGGAALPARPRDRDTLSVVIIAQNEAANLAELLPRLGWADEVLVVDGGSRDATAQVARAHGVRYLRRPFDHFAAQRNFAWSEAQGTWILSLDADERPGPGLVAEIARLMRRADHAGYRLPIRSTIFGRPFRFAGTQDDRPIRLARRAASAWLGQVHEALVVRGSVGRLTAGLDHVTLPDMATFLAKMHRYTRLTAQARVAAGRPPAASDRWWRPVREVFRRLIWKHGWLDGPRGWLFCGLSGLSEWVLAERHARYWRESRRGARPVANHRVEFARVSSAGVARTVAEWGLVEPVEAADAAVTVAAIPAQPTERPPQRGAA